MASSILSLLPLIDSEYIFITGDFAFLAKLKLGKKLDALNCFHEAVLQKYPESTIVFPLASMNLCNTCTPFSLAETPSFQMGSYPEFVRTQVGCERTLHPFWSCGAVGMNARIITSDISPHAYAVGSIWDRLCNKQAVQITIGKSVNFALTSIHHCETICGVPYRYTKEFLHPIVDKKGIVSHGLFYLSVFYPSLNITKRVKRNDVFLDVLPASVFRTYESASNPVSPHISTLKLYEFREYACNIISSQMYSYLEAPPNEDLRIYRN